MGDVFEDGGEGGHPDAPSHQDGHFVVPPGLVALPEWPVHQNLGEKIIILLFNFFFFYYLLILFYYLKALLLGKALLFKICGRFFKYYFLKCFSLSLLFSLCNSLITF